ncbi:hypothetical protein F441_02968, partial [Phytophthora nicotianae CJ01A1]
YERDSGHEDLQQRELHQIQSENRPQVQRREVSNKTSAKNKLDADATTDTRSGGGKWRQVRGHGHRRLQNRAQLRGGQAHDES